MAVRGKGPEKIDPVQRLLHSGILISKGELINRRLKFVLDPIAELCLSKNLEVSERMGRGLVTYYVLFFIQLETRRVCLAGITPYPDQQWMEQQARNVTMKDWGFLAHSRYLLHDRDGKFCPVFREVIQAGKVTPPEVTGPQAEPQCVCRALGTLGEGGMPSRLIFFGEHSLHRTLTEYIDHFHRERNHQGKENMLLFPAPRGPVLLRGTVQCKERLGGLLRYYQARAA